MICEYCHNRLATDKHHLFSQTKWARALYGALIDHPRNIMHVCNDCHMTKPIPKYNERQFCDALDIMPRSKTENMLARGEFLLHAHGIIVN